MADRLGAGCTRRHCELFRVESQAASVWAIVRSASNMQHAAGALMRAGVATASVAVGLANMKHPALQGRAWEGKGLTLDCVTCEVWILPKV